MARGWVCLKRPQNLSAVDRPCLCTFKKFKTKRVWLSLLAGVAYSIPPFCFNNWALSVWCVYLTIPWPTWHIYICLYIYMSVSISISIYRTMNTAKIEYVFFKVNS
jgi:hypothetical protein